MQKEKEQTNKEIRENRIFAIIVVAVFALAGYLFKDTPPSNKYRHYRMAETLEEENDK